MTESPVAWWAQSLVGAAGIGLILYQVQRLYKILETLPNQFANKEHTQKELSDHQCNIKRLFDKVDNHETRISHLEP